METWIWIVLAIAVLGGAYAAIRLPDTVDEPPVEPTYPERIGLAAVEHELKKPQPKQPRKKPVKKIIKRKGAKK